jgi:hypothetical protein
LLISPSSLPTLTLLPSLSTLTLSTLLAIYDIPRGFAEFVLKVLNLIHDIFGILLTSAHNHDVRALDKTHVDRAEHTFGSKGVKGRACAGRLLRWDDRPSGHRRRRQRRYLTAIRQQWHFFTGCQDGRTGGIGVSTVAARDLLFGQSSCDFHLWDQQRNRPNQQHGREGGPLPRPAWAAFCGGLFRDERAGAFCAQDVVAQIGRRFSAEDFAESPFEQAVAEVVDVFLADAGGFVIVLLS